MEKIDAKDAARVSEAIEIWVGPVPSYSYDREAALVDRFGKAGAAELVPIIRALEDDFYATQASDVADSLRTMHQLASSDFKSKHPELSDRAVHALANRYVYENR
jgi:hypothetical protein